jgi:hypothetical protein
VLFQCVGPFRVSLSLTLHSGFLKHVDRIYSSQASWLFAPPKLKWEDQIVLITGGAFWMPVSPGYC